MTEVIQSLIAKEGLYGCCFVQDETGYTRASVVTLGRRVWAQPLSQGPSAQRAEFQESIQALPGEGHMDSWYAFTTVHIHGVLYRLGELLTSAGKKVRSKLKNNNKILALLEAILLLGDRHCLLQRPSKEEVPKTQGNMAVDLATLKAALEPEELLQISVTLPNPDQYPTYTQRNQVDKKERRQTGDICGGSCWERAPYSLM